MTMTLQPMVFVVDDDEAVRNSLRRLLESAAHYVVTYPDAETFLERFDAARPGCLVLDLRMPGMGGGLLQERLAALGSHLPVIVLSAHGTIESAVRAMKLGAVDFLRKPCEARALLNCVQRAIEQDVERHRRQDARRDLDERLVRLTAREREIMQHIVAGKTSKGIAAELGISRKTVDVHRSSIFNKLQVSSAVDLLACLRDDGGSRDAGSSP